MESLYIFKISLQIFFIIEKGVSIRIHQGVFKIGAFNVRSAK